MTTPPPENKESTSGYVEGWDDVEIGEGQLFSASQIKKASGYVKAAPKVKDTAKINTDSIQNSIAGMLKKGLEDSIKYPTEDEAFTTLILTIMRKYHSVGTSLESKFTDADELIVKYKDKTYNIKHLLITEIFNMAGNTHGQKNALRRFLRTYSPLWYEYCRHVPPTMFDTTLAFKWGMPAEYACYAADWFEPVDHMSEEAIQACRLKTAEALRGAQTRGVQSKVLNLAQLNRRF
uniref:Coat protein n=1 Tax=Olive leaf mottling virus TaxID=3162628 RepID=A0AAU7NIP7_9CLOS